jgi:hypothetical protein
LRRDEIHELQLSPQLAAIFLLPGCGGNGQSRVNNVESICHLGILSHRRAEQVSHESVAMPEIQARRAVVVVPGGRPLHEYANLYINARNIMLYKILYRHAELCVVRIDSSVVDLPGVIVTGQNAASDYCRFSPAPLGLSIVNRELTFAQYWTHPDLYEKWRRASATCAEILVPDYVDPSFLIGAYVSCQEALERFNLVGVNLPAEINRYLFFR